ncbi:zinc finger CCCH domain-containing protein 37 isoform X5 [Cucumis sativus]|uniref:zinc finger CCCH domain-containing protein 37 isoform X5 n=1 Tax=Cucumis sativus TaxID=3659 RepID=UPI0005EC5A25|nr:zinc finger CCCH domain-containing protein 37 isoform X5 [Cucumis sativus]
MVRCLPLPLPLRFHLFPPRTRLPVPFPTSSPAVISCQTRCPPVSPLSTLLLIVVPPCIRLRKKALCCRLPTLFRERRIWSLNSLGRVLTLQLRLTLLFLASNVLLTVPQIANSEDLPERLGDPDCPYFLKTQRCKFGSRCKFNHPKDRSDSVGAEKSDASSLPERPSEPLCAFYVKTGNCKFGINCKFHHPKDIQILSGEEYGNSEQTLMVKTEERAGDFKLVKPPISLSPAIMHNSKGLPIRPGEVDCPFYLKTGSCKYGTTCRYNHPDRNAINPSTPAMVHPAMVSTANMNTGFVNPSNAIYQAVDPRLIQPLLGSGSSIYPQRPGQIECDFYMKTGDCKFGERCKFHHPIDRSAPKQGALHNVKLTLAGLPRREEAIICPYYLKTGTCKYGTTCKFDHPPPGEVMTMAAVQSAPGKEGEDRIDESVDERL